MLRLLEVATIVTMFPFGSADWACGQMPDYRTNDNKTCYKVYSDKLDIDPATARCLTDGGQLASIPNAFVNSYVSQLAQKEPTGDDRFWLGIECYTRKTCHNLDGTSFGYSNFSPGQPSTGTEVYLDRTSQQWFTGVVTSHYGYICEVKYGTLPEKCPVSYEVHLNHCYRISTEVKTRDDASAECKKMPGGYLATIDSFYVNSQLRDMANSTLPDDGFLHIGLTCSNVTQTADKSSCQWDDGTPFNFSSFASGMPLVYYPARPCVGFYSTGLWYNSVPCERQLPFVCQVPVTY